MTIDNDTLRNDYIGDGSATVFPYTFRIFDQSEIVVILTDLLAIENTQTITAQYSVTGVDAAAGGNVVMLTPPPLNYKLALLPSITLTQTTDLVNESGFFQERIEDRFDKLCRADQINAEKLSRTVTVQDSEVGDPALLTLPPLASRKGYSLGFDSVTGAFTAISQLPTSSVSAAMSPVVTAATLAAGRTAFGLGNSATRNVGTTAGTVAAGDDARLSDTRTPTAASVVNASMTVGALPFLARIINATVIAITATATATIDRNHYVTGTAGNYDIPLPAIAASSGKVISFEVGDYLVANKFYRLDAGVGVLIAGRTRYLTLAHGNTVTLYSDGVKWIPLTMSLNTIWEDGGPITIAGSTSGGTKGTTTGGANQDRFWWRRVEDSMHARLEYRQSTNGTAGVGVYLITLPMGVSANTAKIATNTELTRPFGAECLAGSFVYSDSSNTIVGVSLMHNATQFKGAFVYNIDTGVFGPASIGTLAASPIAFAAKLEVPIVDW